MKQANLLNRVMHLQRNFQGTSPEARTSQVNLSRGQFLDISHFIFCHSYWYGDIRIFCWSWYHNSKFVWIAFVWNHIAHEWVYFKYMMLQFTKTKLFSKQKQNKNLLLLCFNVFFQKKSQPKQKYTKKVDSPSPYYMLILV